MLPEILDVRGVATILPPHEGNVIAGLLEDLGPTALVTLAFNLLIHCLTRSEQGFLYLQCRNCVLQPVEAVLDVVLGCASCFEGA